jgi:hypothetical protein
VTIDCDLAVVVAQRNRYRRMAMDSAQAIVTLAENLRVAREALREIADGSDPYNQQTAERALDLLDTAPGATPGGQQGAV